MSFNILHDDSGDRVVIKHYGTKGMKWGVRKARNARKAYNKVLDNEFDARRGYAVKNLKSVGLNRAAAAVGRESRDGSALAPTAKAAKSAIGRKLRSGLANRQEKGAVAIEKDAKSLRDHAKNLDKQVKAAQKESDGYTREFARAAKANEVPSRIARENSANALNKLLGLKQQAKEYHAMADEMDTMSKSWADLAVQNRKKAQHEGRQEEMIRVGTLYIDEVL